MKQEEKKLARELRYKGTAITTICKQLNVAKSTVFEWTKDIKLTTAQTKILQHDSKSRNAILANAKMVENYKKARDAWFDNGKQLAKKDADFRMLCVLYWGEGSKDRNRFCITNSDIKMLAAVHKCIQKLFPYQTSDLRVRAYLNKGFTENSIREKWGILKIPMKLKILKNKKRFKSSHAKLYYGVGQYNINNTELVQKVLGGIEYLREVGITG